MKFAAVLALVAAVTAVSAETNAKRFARGLPPNAPFKRATPASPAHRGHPSGTPGCSTGSLHCCDSVQSSGNNNELDQLLQLLGISVDPGTSVGLDCSPISVIGGGGNKCTQQPVCCNDNHFNGIVNLGCSPFNL